VRALTIVSNELQAPPIAVLIRLNDHPNSSLGSGEDVVERRRRERLLFRRTARRCGAQRGDHVGEIVEDRQRVRLGGALGGDRLHPIEVVEAAGRALADQRVVVGAGVGLAGLVELADHGEAGGLAVDDVAGLGDGVVGARRGEIALRDALVDRGAEHGERGAVVAGLEDVGRALLPPQLEAVAVAAADHGAAIAQRLVGAGELLGLEVPLGRAP